MNRDRISCHLSVTTLLMIPEVAGMDRQHLLIPLFPISVSLLLSAPLPLPCSWWHFLSYLCSLEVLLEPSRTDHALPGTAPAAETPPQPCRHPVHLGKESDLLFLLRDSPQLWFERSLLNSWFCLSEWCSMGKSSTVSGAAQAQHVHSAALPAASEHAVGRSKTEICFLPATSWYLCSFVSGLISIAEHHTSVYSWPLYFWVIREQLPDLWHRLCLVPSVVFSMGVITALCLRAAGGDSGVNQV